MANMNHSHNSILIADDNEVNRNLLCQHLEKQGYTVAMANDGQQAMDMMAVEGFDLLLLDIIMPVMDGYAVLEAMRSHPKLGNLPVIVLTSETETSNVIRCVELGANDYLLKPFDMVALRNRIVRCLLNRHMREEVTGDLNWQSEKIPRILVVEDDDMSRLLLQKRVSRAGYHVESVPDGKAAMDVLSQRTFDLVLLDIMMPYMNGFEVLERIKADGQLSRLAVIMISALDDQESIEKCLQAGAEDYITKPFNALILKSRILSCMQSKLIRDEDIDSMEA